MRVEMEIALDWNSNHILGSFKSNGKLAAPEISGSNIVIKFLLF
jgi:hypothetical protein